MLLRRRFFKKNINFTLLAPKLPPLWLRGHEIYNFLSPYPTDATYQICHSSWEEDVNGRRTTHDDGGQPIAIYHLSDSGDLKKSFPLSVKYTPSPLKRNLSLHWIFWRVMTFPPLFLLKSLSPIHFVKIRLYNFLGNEFIVKMYKL